MSDASTPPVYTGPGSPRDVPPRPGEFGVDPSTLPRGSRLTTSSNRNAGDANSQFLDLRNGELHRADFIEGSCAAPVLEQVQQRRRKGEVVVPQVEKPPSTGGPPLRFESKPQTQRGGAHVQR